MFRASDLLLAAALCSSLSLGKVTTDIETLMTKPTRCVYERAYDMYGAYCAGLNLKDIPSLQTRIEILDFSHNSLTKLKSDTLSGFSSIKYLYLADNRIFQIDHDAFSALTSLESLDLSRNSLGALPSTMFQISTLRKLYLGGNQQLGIGDQISSSVKKTPINAPLQLLDVSDCDLQSIPDLGILPNLKTFNVSSNPLRSMETRLFAKACNLRKVDITKSIDNIPLCKLKPTMIWFDRNHISYLMLDDFSKLNTQEYDNCPSEEHSPELNTTLRQCQSVSLQIENLKTSRRTWLTIGGGLFGFLVGFMLLLFIMHRLNVAQTKKANKKAPATQDDPDRKATAVLLNNAS